MDESGKAADNLLVRYQGDETTLSEAYRRFATNLLGTIEGPKDDTGTFSPFVYDPSEAQSVLQA